MVPYSPGSCCLLKLAVNHLGFVLLQGLMLISEFVFIGWVFLVFCFFAFLGFFFNLHIFFPSVSVFSVFLPEYP